MVKRNTLSSIPSLSPLADANICHEFSLIGEDKRISGVRERECNCNGETKRRNEIKSKEIKRD